MTHLIAKTPEGTKYKFAKQWGLQLVTQEWLFDSVERGMILEEKLYHPEMPADERGKGAWARTKATTPLKRDRVESAADGGPRKIRRTLSTKLQSQNEVVWGDVLGSGASPHSEVGGAEQPSIADTNASSTLRTLSNVSGLDGAAEGINEERKTQGTFSNCRFYIHAFGVKRAETMRQHLVSHDAQVCATIDLLEMPHSGRSFIVVPHNIPKSRLPSTVPATVPVVTEWWVERCLEAKACLEPSTAKFDTPFQNLKIEGFDESMIVSSTGFSGYQLLHLSKAVTLMGGAYDEFFTKRSSVLICNMQRQIRVEKLEMAKEWHVPAVNIKWLLDSIKTGKKELFKPHIVRTKKNDAAGPKSLAWTSSLPDRSFSKSEAFDGFDVSMDQGPTTEDEQPVREFKRPAKPATRDNAAFEKDADDDDDDMETLNDLLTRHKKPGAERDATILAETTGTTPDLSAEDDTPMAAPEDPQVDEPDSRPAPAPQEETAVHQPISPRKSTSYSPSKRNTSPKKSPAGDENTSPQKSSPKKRAPPLLDTQEKLEAITSLLTKLKSKPLTNSDPNQNPRRILGRVPSNVNPLNSSADGLERSFSRNSSLADQVGKKQGGLQRTASMGSVVDQLLAQEGEGDESQNKEPTQTQKVLYLDEDAEAEKELVEARMMGRKAERRPHDRARTMGSIGGGRGVRATKRAKDGEDGMGTSRATGR